MQIAKTVKTKFGEYTIPFTKTQKNLGIGLHYSDEDTPVGKIRHLKSKKIGYERNGAIFDIQEQFFNEKLLRDADITELPADSVGFMIHPFKLNKLVAKNTTQKENNHCLDMDNLAMDFQKEQSILAKELLIKSYDRNKIIFFQDGTYIYFFWRKKLQKIDLALFSCLKDEFESQENV